MSTHLKYNTPIKRVLIANRGEIARRVMQTLREMNIESVAIYSDADSESSHIDAADYAVALGGLTSAESYLNLEKLTEAIKVSGADAVHPGYGFLSENADFAKLVSDLGCKFIGPSPEAIRQLGDKVTAKKLMNEAGVPTVPGSKEPLENLAALQACVKEIGYPLILKAAAGGGGRGMRMVRHDDELQAAYEACRREAKDYFSDDRVFCERYIERGRHIEIQVLGDSHGNAIHLFERDCSIQRRHQKLIEEAPSAFLNDEQRARLGDYAVKAAQSVGYEGAGTVEFICESPEKCYFMEMNTRVQVEHPVTEMITGIDIVRTQVEVAMGDPLPFQQQDIKIQGWAFEARINAENPLLGFIPSAGKLGRVELPRGPGVRVDTHIYENYDIPTHYDSMIAKIIVHAENRPLALKRLRRALGECVLENIDTTIPFHEWLCEHEKFKAGEFDTWFLDENKFDGLSCEQQTYQQYALAALLAQSSEQAPQPTTQKSRQGWSQTQRQERISP